jgi:hypothetical protein
MRQILFYYALFLAVDWSAACFAFVLERKERWRLLWWLFLQRFCYRQVMYLRNDQISLDCVSRARLLVGVSWKEKLPWKHSRDLYHLGFGLRPTGNLLPRQMLPSTKKAATSPPYRSTVILLFPFVSVSCTRKGTRQTNSTSVTGLNNLHFRTLIINSGARFIVERKAHCVRTGRPGVLLFQVKARFHLVNV